MSVYLLGLRGHATYVSCWRCRGAQKAPLHYGGRYIRPNIGATPIASSKYLSEGATNFDFQNAMYMLLGVYLIIGGFLLLLQREAE